MKHNHMNAPGSKHNMGSHESKFNYSPDAPHDFAAHVEHLLGLEAMSPTQKQYGGYEKMADGTIKAVNPITGLRPVIEQAIDEVTSRNPKLEEDALESAIAKRLTGLNDWKNLTTETQNEVMILTGINFDAMTRQEQEMTVNHLLHSPLPFGEIKEALSTDTKIDLGYTHTLDKNKNKTEVEDLGGGEYKIHMISNNNNGSHTGHNLGSFVIDLGAEGKEAQAKEIGNSMVVNTNNNNKLYLDEAAKDVLHQRIDLADFDTDTTFSAWNAKEGVQRKIEETGSGLDQLVDSITGDYFLKKNLSVDELYEGAKAAHEMNEIVVEAIKATGAANNGTISAGDIREINAYIRENHLERWTELHGDDENNMARQPAGR